LTPAAIETIYGIDPTGFLEGDSIKLVIYGAVGYPVTLVHMGGASSEMFIDDATKDAGLDATTVVNFIRIDGTWRLE
jgi:hypothetical protein